MGISREQALECFQSVDLIGIGMEADAVRRRLHPENVVSYVVEGTIDLNALSRSRDEASWERLWREVDETKENGCSCIALRGINASDMKLEDCERLLSSIKRRLPEVSVGGFGAPDVLAIARDEGLGLPETIGRLRDAGLDSIPGGSDACGLAAWLDVHRTAHVLGVPTSAEMVFGAGETIEDRVDFLEAVRRLQEETGGFAAFVPVGFRPAGRDLDGTTAVEGLKTLAISRMFLDTIDNVQADRAGQTLKVLQTALRFGANDAGAVRHGGGTSGSEEDLRRVIRDAGFVPAERNAAYRMMFLGV